MSKKLIDSIAQLNKSIQQYVQARIDLFKLELLKKTSTSMAFLFRLIIVFLIATLVLAFAGSAFVIWYGMAYNDYLEGALIVSGGFIFLLMIALLFGKRILSSVFLSSISKILFDDDEEEN